VGKKRKERIERKGGMGKERQGENATGGGKAEVFLFSARQ